MKQVFTKFALMLLFVSPVINKVDAFPLCLKDSNGGVWRVEVKRIDTIYVAAGKAFLSEGRVWPAWGFYNFKTGETEMHAINPTPIEGCSPHLDSFVNFMQGRGSFDDAIGEYFFKAQGHQENYCDGQNVGGPSYVEVRDCNHLSSLPLLKEGGAVSHYINGSGVAPSSSSMLKVIPNPVSSSAVIQYTLTNKSSVSITIYNYLQQPVKVLVNEKKAAGSYSVTWDGRTSNGTNAISGLYKVVAIIDGKSYSTSMQVIR